MKKYLAVLSSAVMALVLLIGLVGCSSPSSTSSSATSANFSLNENFSYEGVSFKINSAWKVDKDRVLASITPSSNSKITVKTYTNGETKSFESYIEAGGNLLYKDENYEKVQSFDISGGTTVSVFTYVTPTEDGNAGGDACSLVLGYNSGNQAGFDIFLNRGEQSRSTSIDDETLKSLLQSIEFDSSQATKAITYEQLYASDDSEPDSESVESDIPTTSQSNALIKAERYLDMGGFSKKRLIEQLEYEGFSSKDAKYAANNCDANWKEQAVQKAERYLDMGGFSKQRLKEQLKYEGFTSKQINYAVNKVYK